MGDRDPARDLTIGIEEEFQIINAEGELTAHIDTLLAAAKPLFGEDVKAEMLQSVVEIGTQICWNIEEARAELVRLRGGLVALLAKDGLRLASAGTHPFSHWHDQRITEAERYKVLEDEMQDIVRELLIFGTHIHVGIPDPELRIDLMNEARYFLPHLLALSTSSPFWLGRNTGLKSYRSVVWSRFPRSGLPPDLTSYDELENLVELLVKTHCLDDGKKIWWDLRPHYLYPTLEFRICDAATRIDEALCLAALVQSVCAKLLRLRRANLGFRRYPQMLIAENKWRAMRHGVRGRLIDFGRQVEVPVADLIDELLEFVDDVVDDLGCRKEAAYAEVIARDGSSADRQLKVFAETGSLLAVVEALAAETVEGLPTPSRRVGPKG
jgi:glutamate---cysteine ligase / carboxylate-amine ligase